MIMVVLESLPEKVETAGSESNGNATTLLGILKREDIGSGNTKVDRHAGNIRTTPKVGSCDRNNLWLLVCRGMCSNDHLAFSCRRPSLAIESLTE